MTRRVPTGALLRPRRGRTTVLAAVAGIALALALAACGPGSSTPAPAAAAATKAEGLVTDIVTSGPVGVASFTIRTNDGGTMEFTVGTLDVSGGGFPAEHLSEHRLASEPVTVYYRDDAGKHVAIRLTDVVESPSPS